MRIICLFNLKEGASRDDYEAWARGMDIPGVNALSSVYDYTVHRATGLFGSEGKSPYDYVEVIDITNLDHFIADVSDPAFQSIVSGFGQFTDNPMFILTEDL